MSTTGWAVSLRDLRLSDAPRFGPKAACLGEMMHAGLRVPEGFAVAADAHRHIGRTLGIPEDPEEILARNDEIQEMLGKAALPHEVVEAITSSYAPLLSGAALVAVRSSALHEDTPSASFAGTFASFTALSSFEEVLASYRKCLSSFYSDSALDLSLSRGVDLAASGMGVVVQRYVVGAPSGVLFTVDPATGAGERIIVQAVDGPCGDLVDGRSAAATLAIRKGSGRVDDLAANTGAAVDLAPALLIELREAALRAETLFGSAQDIEWTSEGGRLWLLQARPIVGIRRRVEPKEWDPDDGRTWTLDEDGGPLPPLAQEIQLACLRGASRGSAETGNLGVHCSVLVRDGYLYLSPEGIQDAEARRTTWGEYVGGLLDRGQNVFTDVLAPEIRRRRAALERYRHRALTGEEAASYLAESIRYAEDLGELHWKAVWGVCYLEGCSGVRRFQDALGEAALAPRELWDLVYRPSELTGLRLSVDDMAALVGSSPKLRELFESHGSDRVLYAHLARTEQAQRLLRSVSDLLARYGHHPCEGWRDPLGPRLDEKPWTVLGWVRPYLRLPAGEVRRSVARCLEQQERLRARLLGGLEPERRREVQAALSLAEKAFVTRDDHGDLIDLSQTAYARRAALEAGRILASRGLLGKAEEVWLLHSEEIREALAGRRGVERAVLDSRQAEQGRRVAMLPPRYLGPLPAPRTEHGGSPERRVVVRIQGVSGFAGTIRGRVVKVSGEDPAFAGPSIVVIPHVRAFDPGPHLGKVLGIIVASGSSFSHLGSAARELGIPVLFDAQGAWEQLGDGDEVEIDGDAGSLSVLPPGSTG